MRQVILAGMMTAVAATSGCARGRTEDAGPIVERSFTVGAFDKIDLAGAYDATVRTGSAPSVQARGGEKMLERLVVEVKDGALHVYPEKRNSFSWGWGSKRNGKVELTITVPSLRAAELAGSGGIRIDKVTGDSFEGSVAGSGDLTVDQVEVGSLKLGIAGSGEAKAGSGKARSVQYEIAGSGGIDGKGVVAEDADVSIAGSGGVSVHATRAAKVSIAGSGDVDLSGGAKCTTSKMGSGDVRCS
ncbi:MAG TPA: head GIN domain-containing protein [Sphingomicrobium sp.]|nr:head GIN domain-containing protein [Sphingomicrobium sp.]